MIAQFRYFDSYFGRTVGHFLLSPRWPVWRGSTAPPRVYTFNPESRPRFARKFRIPSFIRDIPDPKKPIGKPLVRHRWELYSRRSSWKDAYPGGGPGVLIPSFIRDFPDPEKPIQNPVSIKTPLGAVLGVPFGKMWVPGEEAEGAIGGKFEW